MMKYSTYTCDLVQALELASPNSCMTPATFIDSIRPHNSPEKSKEPRNQPNSTPNKSYPTALVYIHRTQA